MKKLFFACILAISIHNLRADFYPQKLINNPITQTFIHAAFPQELTMPSVSSILASASFIGLDAMGYKDTLIGSNSDLSVFLNYIGYWPLLAALISFAIKRVPPEKDANCIPIHFFVQTLLYSLFFDEFKKKLGLTQASTIFGLFISSCFYSMHLAYKKNIALESSHIY